MLLVSQNIILRLLQAVESLGYSPELICKNVGFSIEELKSGQLVLTDDDAEKIWSACVKTTNNSELGFYIGANASVESLGLLGQLFQNAVSIKELLLFASEYIWLITDLIKFEVIFRKKDFYIQISPDLHLQTLFPARSKQVCLLTLAISLRLKEVLTLSSSESAIISMPYELKNRDELLKFTSNSPSINNENHYRIFGSIEILQIKILNANPEMLISILDYCNNHINATHKTWSSKVEKFLLSHYIYKFPVLNDVSNHFNVGERTLQRNLNNENTSYKDILKRVRFNLAIIELKKTNNIKEIAAKIGFANASSFRKAFKNWSGISIREYTQNSLKKHI